MTDVEKEILDFIDRSYNTKKYFLFGPRKSITLDTNIRDDLKLVYEDNVEMMDSYFQRWCVERAGFNILNYFNPDFLGSREPDPHKPLTLRMLAASASAGKWLYD